VGVDSTPRDQTPGELAAKASTRRAVVPPNTSSTFSFVVTAVGLVVVSWGLFGLWRFYKSLGVVGTRLTVATIVELVAAALCAFSVLYPAAKALLASSQARNEAKAGKLYEARATGKRARDWCSHAVSLSVVVTIVGFLLLAAANEHGRVRKPFLNFNIMGHYFWKTVKYFVLKNLKVALIAFPLVLIWGLVLAIARLAPGRTGRPVRWMATFYIDLFRGIPGLVNMTLIGFGLPLSRLPIVSKFDSEKYAILSLTITYGAYVAEVYRAGIESIHWSQTAASRSLGLSNASTMRFVIVPQAVRRIIPPLLNDFISIQKDTALLSQLGYFEVFSYAKGINSGEANLSAMTLVALLFYAITIPQARYVDRQLDNEKKRTAGGK
jgi:polar amino acid transport system permease protein